MVDLNLPLVKQGVLIVPTPQRLRLREVTQPAQSYTAGGGGDLNLLLSAQDRALNQYSLLERSVSQFKVSDSEAGVSTSDSGYKQL